MTLQLNRRLITFIAIVFSICLIGNRTEASNPSMTNSNLFKNNSDKLESCGNIKNDQDGYFSLLNKIKPNCSEITNQSSNFKAYSFSINPPILDKEFVQAQIAGGSILFLSLLNNNSQYLGSLWFTGATVIPYFMQSDAQFGMEYNYLAISPPFLVMGLLNSYFSLSNAPKNRIFISNFVGFNIALLWKKRIFKFIKPKSVSFEDPAVKNTSRWTILPILNVDFNLLKFGIRITWK